MWNELAAMVVGFGIAVIGFMLFVQKPVAVAQPQERIVIRPGPGPGPANPCPPGGYGTRRNNATSTGIGPGQQLFPGSNRSTVATNMTGKLGARGGRRRHTRKLRKQYGGATRFLVNIKQIIDCVGECKVLDRFILDTNGNTFNYEEFKKAEQSGSLPSPKIFAERIEALMDKETTKY